MNQLNGYLNLPGGSSFRRTLNDGLRLEPHGILAAVDFHESALRLFKGHMAYHHVRMDAHLLAVLAASCQPRIRHVQAAYGGLWKYFLFIGRKMPCVAQPCGSR